MRRNRSLIPFILIFLLAGCNSEPVDSVFPPTITSFTTNFSTISGGQPVTLSWAVTGADTLNMYLSSGESYLITESSQAFAPAVTTTYRLVAINSAGNVYQDLTVTVTTAAPTPPTIPGAPTIASFTATPSTISSGETAVLSWSVSDTATSLSISPDVGDVSSLTSFVVSPSATTTYTLTAFGAGDSDTSIATVTVEDDEPAPPEDPEPPAPPENPEPPEEPTPPEDPEPTPEPPTVSSFTVDPDDYAVRGDSIELSWELSGDVDEVRVRPEPGVVTGDSVTLRPTSSTTYTLSVKNAGGTTTDSVRATVLRYDPDGPDVNCTDFSSQSEAQEFFEFTGPGDPHQLDSDNDGIACETL